MKIVCGKCSAEVELPKEGESPEIRCPSCGAVFRMPSLAEGEEFPRPDTFPGYRIVAIVGHGGMGTVYRAVQLSMDREVAIKVLLRKYASVPRFVARFEREASALAVLNHANIVAVIDRGRVEDMYYFVMEYVRGRTLRYFIKNKLLSIERSVEIASEICQALEAAHACGVIHRDVKPGNILVQEDGRVKVADFGIAHMIEEEDATEQERRSRLGTARYMAPEQHGTGETVDPRADIYALGVTLHEMLTGTLPKGGPVSDINHLVTADLDRIVERALRESRDERFQSAAEMREALEVFLKTSRLEKTPATSLLAVPPLLTLSCPACGGAVHPSGLSCPQCGAALRERCYRVGCDGMNPAGAERCVRCGGHTELLRRQRRAELERFLEQAEAQAAEGEADDALRLLEAVERDPHAEFAKLRERAREAIGDLRRRHYADLAATIARVAAATLIIAAAGVGSYWGVLKLTARSRATAHGKGRPTTGEASTGTARPAHGPVKPAPSEGPPSPQERRGILDDYLVALTDRAWTKRAAPLRVMAACDAGLYLAAGRPDGLAAERLARTLEKLDDTGSPAPSRDELYERLAGSLDALCDTVATELFANPRLQDDIKRLASRRVKGRGAAREPAQRLEVATATLQDFMAAAEVALSTKRGTATRLVLLDASVAATTRQDEFRRAADRIIRTTRLLVWYLRRQNRPGLALELLEDAAQRADRGAQERDDMARLALGVESFIEAMGTLPPRRATD